MAKYENEKQFKIIKEFLNVFFQILLSNGQAKLLKRNYPDCRSAPNEIRVAVKSLLLTQPVLMPSGSHLNGGEENLFKFPSSESMNELRVII